MSVSQRSIPNADDWAGHEADLDADYAYERMFGKSIDDLMYEFRDQMSEIYIELLAMPRRAFQYYVFVLVKLLNSPGEGVGQSDCASGFLNLLLAREQADPGSVSQIYVDLRDTVAHVAGNQAFFDANIDIYGDFRDRATEIEALCDAARAQSPGL